MGFLQREIEHWPMFQGTEEQPGAKSEQHSSSEHWMLLHFDSPVGLVFLCPRLRYMNIIIGEGQKIDVFQQS